MTINERTDYAAAEWAEIEAEYLAQHPEIQEAVPRWADRIRIEAIDDPREGTIFDFLAVEGDVELYAVGRLREGAITITGGDSPNLYTPTEIEVSDADEIRAIAADLNTIAERFERGVK